MLSFLFIILMIAVFSKLIVLAIRAAWGITHILFSIILLPLMLIGMFLGGLIYIALPLVIIIGLISCFV